jgi:hypothetical protein
MDPSPIQNMYSLFKQKSRSLVHHQWTGRTYSAQWIFRPSYRLSLYVRLKITHRAHVFCGTQWNYNFDRTTVFMTMCVCVHVYTSRYIHTSGFIFASVFQYSTSYTGILHGARASIVVVELLISRVFVNYGLIFRRIFWGG